MGNVTIDEDELEDDDYDFMDEDGQSADRQRAARQKAEPQFKYKNELQELANRTREEIIIDMDDLYTVCA